MINWKSKESRLLLNPRMPEHQLQRLQSAFEKLNHFPDHIWICTSGSTRNDPDELKLAGLSRDAVLFSAQTVNKHLESDSSDIWINPLPFFHVGGLGIDARAFLSGAKVIPFTEKWDPQLFYNTIIENRATLSALVPTQIFDLVQADLTAPAHLKAIIIGGGALSKDLYHRARKLKWPLLPSYGMTECCSQIATASLNSLNASQFPRLQILPHVLLTADQEQLLSIRSKSLLTTYVMSNLKELRIFDPKEKGVLKTEDMGIIEGNQLTVIGRKHDFVKIGGESVHLTRLEKLLEAAKLKTHFNFDAAIIAKADERLGHIIQLKTSAKEQKHVDALLQAYHAEVLPFERVREVLLDSEIKRSALGKLLKN